MFDDPQKELRRLERQLLAEEEPEDDWEDDLDEAHRLLGDAEPEEDLPEEFPLRNYANGYGRGVRNRDRGDVDLEEYSSQVYEPPGKKGIGGLLLLLLLEIIGILAVVVYWILFLLRG